MQPLDVGLNASFKVYYKKTINSWLMRNPGKPGTIYNVAEYVGTAYAKTMTPRYIAFAYKKCGIFAYNPAVFTETRHRQTRWWKSVFRFWQRWRYHAKKFWKPINSNRSKNYKRWTMLSYHRARKWSMVTIDTPEKMILPKIARNGNKKYII